MNSRYFILVEYSHNLSTILICTPSFNFFKHYILSQILFNLIYSLKINHE
jgi:hypothetical protein